MSIGQTKDAGPVKLYGWELSYYTGKVRCYLRYKGMKLEEKGMTLSDLNRAKKRFGSAVMPVVQLPNQSWLQDTSDIIDRMEEQYPDRSVIPAQPVQNFAAHLLETWFDENFVPAAMHTRWNNPENYALFEKEGGDNLLPYMPRFVKNKVVEKSANMLRGFLPGVGIVPAQYAQIEQNATQVLDILDRHFADHDWLLGNRASIADFGLAGPVYGHLGRDPWPKREMVAPRKNLVAWLERASASATARDQHALPDWPDGDVLPESLDPLWPMIAKEFVEKCTAALPQLQQAVADQRPGKPLPRALGEFTASLGGKPFTHWPQSFLFWKVQRLQKLFASFDAAGQQVVRTWLDGHEMGALIDMKVPPLQRRGLRLFAAPE